MQHDLANRAMLVRLSISQWTARKHDKNATHTVENHYGAQDAGRFNKVLIAQDAIKAVEKTANSARTWHYDQTLPWTDEGYRLLPAANFAEYSAKMRELHAAFDAAVDQFCANYPDLVIDAKIRLNGLFNPSDYPRYVRDRFGLETQISPVPMAADFRVALRDEETAEIQAEIEERTAQATTAAHQDLYRRLADTIGHMADKLATDAIFRNSLVDNLRELCELLPRLDLQGDPVLAQIRAHAEQKLLRYDADTLRDNPSARAETARDATAILAAMEGFYNAS